MLGDSPALAVVRTCVLGLLTLGTLSVAVELWLVAHFADTNQLIPFVLVGTGLVSIGAVAVRPSRVMLRTLQFTMLCYAGGGLIGISMHYQANVARQLEADPSLSGGGLFWRAVRSPAPPALAPGVLVQLALLGLVYAYRHPALAEKGWQDTAPE